MCVCGAQHVCSKHLHEDSVACSKRGGLGSDLASLLGLIQSMTAWKLTIGRQYWHTNPSPSELHSYNIPAKWRSLVWVLSQMWCSPVRILLNAYCNFAWYESHTKKNLLEIKLSSWGNPFICSNWLLPHSWKFSSSINIHIFVSSFII